MVLALSVTGLIATFWFFDVPAVPPSAGGLRTALLLGILAALPVGAEVFASCERSGQAQLLRHLPSRALAVIVARLVLMTSVVLLVAAAMVVTEGLATHWTSLADGGALSIHELLDQSSRGGRVDLWWLFALGLHVVTVSVAVVGRNALLATVAGVVLAATAAAIGARLGDGGGVAGPLAAMTLGGLLLLNPLSLATMGATALTLSAKRGRAVRSGMLRGGLVVGVPLIVGSTAAAGFAVAIGWDGVPPFDEPEGRLGRLEVSRDGRFVGVTLHQPRGFDDLEASLWIASTDDLDFERVDKLSPGRWTAGLEGIELSTEGWETGDERILVMAADRWSGYDEPRWLAVDRRTGDATAHTHAELRARAAYGREFIELRREGGLRRLVHATNGTVVDIGTASPKVPRITCDAVFYADEDDRLRCIDLETGADVLIGVDVGEERRFKIGPYGTHCEVRDGDRTRLVELATGRSRDLPLFWGQWTRQEGVIVRHEETGWTLLSVDGDVRLPTERFTHSLHELPDGRWLGADPYEGAIFLFAPDGRLERTVRVGRGRK